jgi:hypothetical protein
MTKRPYRPAKPLVNHLTPTAKAHKTVRVLGASALLLVALVSLNSPALAGSLGGSFDGVATLTPTGTPGIFIQNFAGDGTDATFGAFTATSQSTVDFTSPPTIVITNGMLHEIFVGGTLFGTGSGGGMASGQGTATFTINFVITGGTGIFEHDHGTATITGTITQTSPLSEAVDATYTGTLNTPEPSTLGLMLVGAMSAYRIVRRRLP